MIAKLECVLGVKTTKRTFAFRNLLVAGFLFFSSIVYIAFMCRMLFVGRSPKEYSLIYVELLALISFAEFGFAIAGIINTKNKGHFYRDIKIVNFCISLMAILTTQITILDYTSSESTAYNSYMGIAVGGFIAICSVYIWLAPKISLIDRERNAFVLKDITKNKLIDMDNTVAEILLCKSRVYGSYVYRAAVKDGEVVGNIERGSSLWKRMNILLKILCCILSEILIFVWLAGRFVFFLRSIDLPKRLEVKMSKNGFEKID